jgi:hypothetical protein
MPIPERPHQSRARLAPFHRDQVWQPSAHHEELRDARRTYGFVSPREGNRYPHLSHR